MTCPERGGIAAKPLPLKIFRNLIYHHETGSTNDDASLVARKGLETHGTVVAADRQTAGKGRSDRTWISPPGAGITASFILKNVFPAQRHFYPTLIASVAVSLFLERTCKLRPRIKWPNDVLIGNRKISGILVENEAGMTVIGIGLNLNTDFSGMADLEHTATSVFRETGNIVNGRKALTALARFLEKTWLKCQKSPKTVFQDWKRRLLLPRGRIKIRADGSVHSGRITGIGPDGGLKLKTGSRIATLYNCDTIHPDNGKDHHA